MASESVRIEGKLPMADIEVHTDLDSGDDYEIDTYVAPDGSLRTRRTRSKEIKERGNDKAWQSCQSKGWTFCVAWPLKRVGCMYGCPYGMYVCWGTYGAEWIIWGPEWMDKPLDWPSQLDWEYLIEVFWKLSR